MPSSSHSLVSRAQSPEVSDPAIGAAAYLTYAWSCGMGWIVKASGRESSTPAASGVLLTRTYLKIAGRASSG